jgi:hypothetical protein
MRSTPPTCAPPSAAEEGTEGIKSPGRASYTLRIVGEDGPHGAHVINVFTWVARARTYADVTTRNGYRLVFWNVGNLQYCAVSDAGWDELEGLARLLRDLGSRDAQP